MVGTVLGKKDDQFIRHHLTLREEALKVEAHTWADHCNAQQRAASPACGMNRKLEKPFRGGIWAHSGRSRGWLG